MKSHEESTSRILLIDDNANNIRVLMDCLKDRGFDIAVARDGEMGLKQMKFAPPDLILLDVMMPGMDGFEVCRHIKADDATREIPVIFMTALSSVENKVKGFRAGGVDYISKPIQPEEVLARVNTHLTLRKTQRRVEMQNRQLQHEIAERQQTEEALQKSEAQYRYLTESVRDVIWTLDVETLRFTYVSPSVITLRGYTPEEIMAEPLDAALTPEGRAFVHHRMAQRREKFFASQAAGEEAPCYTEEFQQPCKDGTLVWTEVVTQNALNPSTGRLETHGVSRDIHERKQAEEKLRNSEERLRLVMETVPLPIIMTRPEHGEILLVNDAFCELFGYSREELHAKSSPELYAYPERDRPMIVQDLQTQQVIIHMHREVQARKADGSIFDILLSYKLFEYAGQPAFLASLYDLSERKRTEKALKRSEAQNRALLDAIPDLVFHLDHAGTFMGVHGARENLYIEPEGGLIGHTIVELLPPDVATVMMSYLHETLTSGVMHSYEYQLPMPDGVHDYEARMVPFGENEIIASVRDVSEQKRAEFAIQHARETAEDANKAKSRFLANMSHELRTPLNGILGYAQILSRDAELTTLQQQGLNIIEKSGQHLLTLIDDILDLSKVEAGKIELSPADFELPAFLYNLGEMIRIRAERKGLFFRMEQLDNLPLQVHGDEHRLRQVLLNLLGNAVKFTDRGGVTLKVTKVAKVAQETEHRADSTNTQILLFEVEDTGVGIAPEELEAIFEPFQQVGDAARKVKGTGLGLSISRKFVQLMGGELSAESRPGQGSRFHVALSLPEVELSPGSLKEEPRRITGVKGEAPRLLIVDDHPESRRVLLDLLSPIGFEILEACHGHEALTMLQEYHPGGMISDMMMPDMDGLELIRRIRQEPALRETVVIASSASVYEDDRQRCAAAGSDDFLPKPIQAEQLFEQLQRHLTLEWDYEAPQPAPSKQIDLSVASLLLPSANTLEDLIDIVKFGDILALREKLDALERDRPDLREFLAKVRQYEQQYQLLVLRDFLHSCQLHQQTQREPQDIQAQLAGLEPHLLEQLEQYATCNDISMMERTIDSLRPHRAALADTLAALAYNYDYEKILALVKTGKHAL